jgi:hypothetical protein
MVLAIFSKSYICIYEEEELRSTVGASVNGVSVLLEIYYRALRVQYKFAKVLPSIGR